MSEDEPTQLIEYISKQISKILDDEENLVVKLESRLKKEFPPNIDEIKELLLDIHISRTINDKLIREYKASSGSFVKEFGKYAPGLKKVGTGYQIHNWQIDFAKWNKLQSITPELEQRKKEIDERYAISYKELEIVIVQGRESAKILDILYQMNPEFPVNLQRLAELVQMEREQTENALVYVLKLYPELGKYDTLSQMLVFDKPSKVKELLQKPNKKVKCSNCDSEIKSTDSKCPNCGKEFDVCPICNGIITTEKTYSCKSCKRLYHKNHIEEWMKINRNCPICKEKL